MWGHTRRRGHPFGIDGSTKVLGCRAGGGQTEFGHVEKIALGVSLQFFVVAGRGGRVVSPGTRTRRARGKKARNLSLPHIACRRGLRAAVAFRHIIHFSSRFFPATALQVNDQHLPFLVPLGGNLLPFVHASLPHERGAGDEKSAPFRF